MIIQQNKANIPTDQSVRDGDLDARLAKIYVKVANQNTVIWHKSGRVPRQIELVWKDGFLDFKVALDSKGQPMVDEEKAVLQFSAANVTTVIRFA
jgi:hypothetical protein